MLTNFVNGNDARMLQAGCGFSFQTETLEVGCSGPMPQVDYFQRYDSIKALLSSAIDYTLAASTISSSNS